MSILEWCYVVFSILFTFIFILRVWYEQGDLGAGDVLGGLMLSIILGFVITPLVLMFMSLRGVATLLNKLFSKM